MLITRSCGREVQRVLITERSRREVQRVFIPEDAANKDATIAKYEKESKRVKVAMENGIPYELAGKLSGETEDEMKKDAEAFSKFLKGKTTYPNFTRDTDNKDDSIREATKKMLNNLKGE